MPEVQPPVEVEIETRERLESAISARLSTLDEAALRELGRLVEGEDIAQPKRAPLSRRQFFGQVAVGSLALVASNTATSIISREQAAQEARSEVRAELQPRITSLQDLLALYEKLEDVGLDDSLLGSLSAFRPVLGALREASKIVVLGLAVAEAALLGIEKAEAVVRDGIAYVEGVVDRLEEKVAGLWKMLGEVTGVAVPITDAIGAFFRDILEKIPFGIGAKIQQVIDWIQDLIAELPETLALLRARLLEPLHLEWFDETSENSLDQKLIKPIREELIKPAKRLLAEAERLDSNWEVLVEQPMDRALQQRAAILSEIKAYRTRAA